MIYTEPESILKALKDLGDKADDVRCVVDTNLSYDIDCTVSRYMNGWRFIAKGIGMDKMFYDNEDSNGFKSLELFDDKPTKKKNVWEKNPDVYKSTNSLGNQSKVEEGKIYISFIKDNPISFKVTYSEAKELKSQIHSAIKCHETHFKINK